MIERQRLVNAIRNGMDKGMTPSRVADAALDSMIDSLTSVGPGATSGDGTRVMLERLRELRDGVR